LLHIYCDRNIYDAICVYGILKQASTIKNEKLQVIQPELFLFQKEI